MCRAFPIALVAGLLALLPTSSARAQAAYGYDSWIYNVPSGASYWNAVGYPGLYTDRSTADFAGLEVAPFRGVAPYGQPPVGAFTSSNGLVVPSTPAAVAVAPVRQPARVQRRPFLRRLRARQ